MGRFLAAGMVVAVVLAVACSNNGGGAGGGQTCPAGFDAGGILGGTEAVDEQGQCGNLLMGAGANGSACTKSSDCAPTCCACPNGSGRSAQVVLCRNGTCLVGADVCCVWIDENEGFDGGGAPFLCTQH